MAATEGADARASAPLGACSQPGCTEPKWSAQAGGKDVLLAELCYRHANRPLFNPPPPVKPPGRRSSARMFRDEVARQRSGREAEHRRLRLEADGTA
jgi:hypothetical protein